VVSSLIGSKNYWDSDKNKYTQKELMSKSDIIEWIKNGMYLGSHSHNHINLTKLSEDKIKDELRKSKHELENITGIQINSFSYPFGRINKDVYNSVKNIFKNAVTTNRSRYNPYIHDKYLIPRINMSNNINKFKLFLKIKTIYEDIKYNENQLQM